MRLDVQCLLRLGRVLLCFSILGCSGIAISPVAARPSVAPAVEARDTFDVFMNSQMSGNQAGLFFVNVRTGLSNVVVTKGIHHTLLGNGVLYQEHDTQAVKIAYPDGHTEPFSLIKVPNPNVKVNWVTSSNSKWIVWTFSQKRDLSLLADLYVASVATSTATGQANNQDGQAKLILHTSSTKGIDTVPLAVSDDGTNIFYARQSTEAMPYQLFSGATDVFRLNVTSGQSDELSGKSDCRCAIGFSANGQSFARLTPAGQDNFSFKAHVWNTSIKLDSEIDAPNVAHRQAGNMLFSRDGNLIVYTSARGVPPAKGIPPERYAIVLIDLTRREQRVVASLLKTDLQAVAFEKDNSAVMLVGTDTDGTYKLSLDDGTLRQVSAYTYIGTIS